MHLQLAGLDALDRLVYRSQEAPAGGVRDTVIYSKSPLQERTTDLDSKDTNWYALPVVDVQAPCGVVSVAGIHAYPPVGDAQRWSQGLAAVADWPDQQREHPVILAGYFNSVRSHPGSRVLGDGYAQADGIWPSATWPAVRSFPLLIGIDRIVAKGLSITGSSSQINDGADQLAVSATVEFLH